MYTLRVYKITTLLILPPHPHDRPLTLPFLPQSSVPAALRVFPLNRLSLCRPRLGGFDGDFMIGNLLKNYWH